MVVQAYHGGGKWACRGWPGPTYPAIQIRVSDLLQVTFSAKLEDEIKSSHWLDLFHSTSDIIQPLKHSLNWGKQFNLLRFLQEYQHHSPPTLMANSWETGFDPGASSSTLNIFWAIVVRQALYHNPHA